MYRKNESDFDREFRRSGYIFNDIFGIVAVIILAVVIFQFVILPYFAYKAVQAMPKDCTPAVVVNQKDGQTQYTVGCKK